VFCSFTLVTVLTVFACNSDKGPAQLKEGISELSQPKNDSLLARGKYLLSQQHYSDQDIEAIALYL
jgi:hypothetical protein